MGDEGKIWNWDPGRQMKVYRVWDRKEGRKKKERVRKREREREGDWGGRESERGQGG